MAGSAWPRTLDAFLHRLWPHFAAALLRLLPKGREKWLGGRAEGKAADSPSRPLRGTGRGRLADPPHQMDQVLSRPQRAQPVGFAAEDGWRRFLSRLRRWPDLHIPAAGESDRNHRPACIAFGRFVLDRRRRPLPYLSRLHPGFARNNLRGRGGPAYANWPRLAARLAPQARS